MNGTLEVFYDGDCPLCRREIDLLRRWDKRQAIKFVDLAAADFDPATVGQTHAELMALIHGRLPDGTVIVGVEVFRQIYQRLGFGTLVWLSRCPGVSGLLEAAYRLFARYRLPLTGRSPGTGAEGACQTGRCSSRR